jgi:prolycopene isomerase
MDFGGELRLSCPVRKIKTRKNEVQGIIVQKDDFVSAKYVVSNCDARQTFLKFLGKRIVANEVLDELNAMIPSLSMFILYLGINSSLNPQIAPGTNIWFLPHYAIEDMYRLAKKRTAHALAEYMFRISPDGNTILAFINAPFRNKTYWDTNKARIIDLFVKGIEQHFIPGLRDHIAFKGAATPNTLFRYTLNYRGAAYGWASMPSQFVNPNFRRPSFIQGLSLTGHWTTYAQGIPGVIYIGYDTAKALLKK